MAQQLQNSTPLIRQHFASAYLSNDEPDPISLPTIRPNVKWSKILINSIPTGVSPNRTAKSPEECHTALLMENPLYAKLTVTQKPSWVRNPSTYTGAMSSLIVAFEDSDRSLLRSLLTNKVLYIFGSCTTLRKWKQQPTPYRNSHTCATSPSTPSPEDMTLQEAFNAITAPIQHPSPQLARLDKGSNQDMKGGGGRRKKHATIK